MNELTQYINDLCRDEKTKRANGDKLKRLFSPLTEIPLEERFNKYTCVSLSIKTGNDSEDIIKDILTSYGATILESRQTESEDLDIYFLYKNKKHLIETKIRDDHDSGKKKEISDDFLKKKEIFENETSIHWFVDSGFTKNKSYYNTCIKEYNVYGKDFQTQLIKIFGEQAKNFNQEYYKRLKEHKKQVKENFRKYSLLNYSVEIDEYDPMAVVYIFDYSDLDELEEDFFKCKIPTDKVLKKINESQAPSTKKNKIKKILEAYENGTYEYSFH